MNRFRRLISALLGCSLVTGCSFYETAVRTLWTEPSVYSATKDACYTRERCCQLANEAWNSQVRRDPEIACSAEFEQGFKDGFADYLYAGGTGEPPPVPPRCMWNLDYRTPRGHQAVDDWFAGFRHGAALVRARGYREKMTIQSSLSCNAAVPSAAPEPAEQAQPIEVIPTRPPTRPLAAPLPPNDDEGWKRPSDNT